MARLIAEVGAHREQFRQRLANTRGMVRIASAYITETGVLSDVGGRDVRLLTGLSAMDIISGATSLDSLETLIRTGVQCRFLSGAPKFHAKVYIFGDDSAIVTSANFTARALDSNIELGVLLSGSEVGQLIGWFDGVWDSAEPLDAPYLSYWRQATSDLRERFASLRASCRIADRASILTSARSKGAPTWAPSAPSYFLCNTDRKHGRFSPSSGHEREGKMRTTRFVTAWEYFDHGSHMKAVKRGDLILMYANRIGIIGVGEAVGPCEILEPGSPDRISRHLSDEEEGREWRIPVEWLRWVSDGDACPWEGVLPPTFQNVSGERWSDHRDRVVRHFFDAPESAREQEIEP